MKPAAKTVMDYYAARPWRTYEPVLSTNAGVVHESSVKNKAEEQIYSKLKLENIASQLCEKIKAR